MIECVDVGKTFEGRTALAGISFELVPGTLNAIVGANAAGKSTLLRCLAGLQTHAGTIRVSRPIAYLPQIVRLPPAATAGEVRALFSARPDRSPGDDLGVDDAARIETLSGGQKQRVAISAVLACGARTLLLDEPMATLDDDARDELLRRLRAATRAGATVVVSDPAPIVSGVLGRFDRVLTLERGRLVP